MTSLYEAKWNTVMYFEPSTTWINPLTKMFLTAEIYSTNNSRATVSYNCGCEIICYLNHTDPEFFVITDKRVCKTHTFQTPKLYTTSGVGGFYFNCPVCEYPLTEGEDFECEDECDEYHPEVHAYEHFAGWCDALHDCPVCSNPLPEKQIFESWKEHLIALNEEALREDYIPEPEW